MATPTSRPRGNIEPRGDGSFRVRVYAGIDPVTRKPHYLKETVYGLSAAKKKRTELLHQVDQGRAAKTSCTFNHLLDKYFEQDLGLADKTLKDYRQMADDYIRPLIGGLTLPEVKKQLVHKVEGLYSELSKCKRRCGGKNGLIDHRNPERTGRQVPDLKGHRCNPRCLPHRCVPLARTTIRLIHTVISGACAAAERWQWMSPNPAARVKQPKRPRPNPQAPSAEQAAALVGAAFNQDVEWGTSIWILMMTGDRRKGHVNLQIKDFNFDKNLMRITDFKTQHERWILLDDITMELIAEQIERIRRRRRVLLGLETTGEEYLHSYKEDNSQPGSVDWFTHRFTAMAKQLGFQASPHKLRHYTATELIDAKVSVPAVAERLGHRSGGRTTLNYYAAWRRESDDAAMRVLADRMPELPQVRRNRYDRDRSIGQPCRTDPVIEQRIIELRTTELLSATKIKVRLEAEGIDVAASTIWLVLKRHGLNKLSQLEPQPSTSAQQEIDCGTMTPILSPPAPDPGPAGEPETPEELLRAMTETQQRLAALQSRLSTALAGLSDR